jgi:outer membrane protein OmpA-like peptidoglycan-associated protein
MTMGDHYILLNKLRKQGVGIIEIGSTLTLIMQTDCFFQGTSTKLKPHRAYTLDLVAQLVKSYPNTPVTVSGHTDIVPTSKRQKSKTFDYAQVIASYLWNHGVPMQHVRVVADGSKYNVSKMSTSQGAADNRRVELYIGVRDPY